MNLTLLYTWSEEIRRWMPCLMQWQATGLALLSIGVVLAQHSQLTRIAEALVGWGRIPSVEKRLKRWVGNERIEVLLCCEGWIRWVWSHYDAHRPILLVDETKLGSWVGVMMVSLAYHNRAIPLIWRCYVADCAEAYPQQGQVLLVWQLLARVLAVLPAGCRPLVELDRGIGHSSALLRALNQLHQSYGLTYLVRVKQTARFTSRRGKSQLLRQMVKPGESQRCFGNLFTRQHQVPGWLHLLWEAGQAEAWCLFSNDPTLRGSLYARRMWQEESFRDLKGGGWQWEASHLHSPRRAERLILALTLAYAWMLTLGTFVWHAEAELQRQVTDGDGLRRYSLFRLGLRYFRWLWTQVCPQSAVGLFFAPPAFQPLL